MGKASRSIVVWPQLFTSDKTKGGFIKVKSVTFLYSWAWFQIQKDIYCGSFSHHDLNFCMLGYTNPSRDTLLRDAISSYDHNQVGLNIYR